MTKEQQDYLEMVKMFFEFVNELDSKNFDDAAQLYFLRWLKDKLNREVD